MDLLLSPFPLGKPYGEIDMSAEQPTGPDTRPFGLSFARRSEKSETLTLSTIGYDSERQIGVILDGDAWVPIARHTTGQTGTRTNPDGHKGPDSDTDHRED